MNETNPRDQIDLLKHIENLTENINHQMSSRSHSVLKRYPLTFMLLALFGIEAVSEGAKGIIEEVSIFKENPLYMLVGGLVTLTILGVLYKKLDQ